MVWVASALYVLGRVPLLDLTSSEKRVLIPGSWAIFTVVKLVRLIKWKVNWPEDGNSDLQISRRGANLPEHDAGEGASNEFASLPSVSVHNGQLATLIFVLIFLCYNVCVGLWGRAQQLCWLESLYEATGTQNPRDILLRGKRQQMA